MKRAIVTCVRVSKDNKTGEDNVWVTMSIMPSKMTNGNLFYPKSSDISVTTFAGAIKSPDKFKQYKELKIGDLVNVHYSLNEYNQKPFISEVVFFADSPYKESDLIV